MLGFVSDSRFTITQPTRLGPLRRPAPTVGVLFHVNAGPIRRPRRALSKRSEARRNNAVRYGRFAFRLASRSQRPRPGMAAPFHVKRGRLSTAGPSVERAKRDETHLHGSSGSRLDSGHTLAQ